MIRFNPGEAPRNMTDITIGQRISGHLSAAIMAHWREFRRWAWTSIEPIEDEL